MSIKDLAHDVQEKVKTLVEQGKHIDAIKVVNDAGHSLKDAKTRVEGYISSLFEKDLGKK